MPKTLPKIGDRHTFVVLTGYKLVQDRPFTCRPACTCGTCNGSSTEVEATITEVLRWADNSIELLGIDDEGNTRRELAVAPHGDRCQ